MQKICVLGLGYIGLPTASMFATHGFQVVGVDINEHVVEMLNNGEVHIHEPGLKTLVQAALESRNLRVACDPEPADVFIIAVPTPLREGDEKRRSRGSGEPRSRGAEENSPPPKRADLSYVVAAAESIVPHLRPGNLVILESTVPPRTTMDILVPILERSGLRVNRDQGSREAKVSSETRELDLLESRGEGEDLYVAHCPERVLPGRVLTELVENDRVIGGSNWASAEAARELYAIFVQGTITLTDATTAEVVKLMENTYRDVNIALANEFALIANELGINVWEAIAIANRHPRVNILHPGPGVGGHCIPVDPWFLVEAAPETARLIRQAREVNDGMPAQVVSMIHEQVVGIEQPTIAVLGLAYKANVDDVRESPALQVIEGLAALGYELRLCDPHVNAFPWPLLPILEAVRGADCLALLTDHAEFVALRPQLLGSLMRHRRVVDTRGCLKPQEWVAEGFRVVRLGDGAVSGRC